MTCSCVAQLDPHNTTRTHAVWRIHRAQTGISHVLSLPLSQVYMSPII